MKKIKKRACGECTLCCSLPPIVQVDSPPNILCPYCTLKKGCNIYDNRPNACREFNCCWLLDKSVPFDLKPDKSHIIFEKISDTIYLASVEYTHLDAWKEQNVLDYIKRLNDDNISVIVSSFTDNPKIIFPTKGITQDEVMSEAMDIYNKDYL